MINYILIAYIHKTESGCSGRLIAHIPLGGHFARSYHDAFDACYKYRRCGCIDTCNGCCYIGADWYDIYEGNTTKALPGSDACHSWARLKNNYFAEGRL